MNEARATLRDHESRSGAQLPLFTQSERLDRRFAAHREAHPAVYRKLLLLARQAKDDGWRKVGIGFLWERMRWEFGPHARDVYGFGCNNDLRSRYARALMEENEDLAGFFETRELRAI